MVTTLFYIENLILCFLIIVNGADQLLTKIAEEQLMWSIKINHSIIFCAEKV